MRRSMLRLALFAATALTAAPVLAEEKRLPTVQPVVAEPASVSLEEQFQNPPNSARPRVWWHWMNGNITIDGIAKDFAWMKRVGIGGVQNFDANLQTPQIVDKRLVYMTPEWKEAFKFAATEADRLGLELAIAASPGWSETGGPWVPPADGLKKVVWSETEIEGGKPFAGKVAAPPGVTGAFQSIAKSRSSNSVLSGNTPEKAVPQFYSDIAVLAVPLSAAPAMPAPRVTDGNGKAIDARALSDGDYASAIELTKSGSKLVPLLFEFDTPQMVRSASLFMPGAAQLFFGSNVLPTLESSDDGQTWRKIAEVQAGQVPTTVSFAPVTAKHFRLSFQPKDNNIFASLGAMSPGIDLAAMGAAMGSMTASMTAPAPKLGEFRLTSEARIDRSETKAGYETEPNYFELSKGVPEAAGAAPGQVIDLTKKLRADGTLDWTPPAGRWRIVRLGASLLGTENHPAPPEATGLEVDKFDGPAVRRYVEHYIGMYRDASGGLIGKRGVQAILTDSIEVGAANWTPQMLAQFKRLRGYDALPWLPALTGTIVGSRAESDKFLFDYRRTLADLMASEHYGTVAKVAHENGLKVYGEALEGGRPSLGDDIAMRSHADIPMSAMWTHSRKDGPQPSHLVDMKGAASVAHIYGQNLVAAESMTSALQYWDHAPNYLKRIIDLEFVNGVNRPVVHTSVHQPRDDKFPGLSLFIFGQYFNRHESWAEMAKPWVDYISRNALMLQQGRNVADVAYYYGEEAPLTGLYGTKPVADAPVRNAYDFLNNDALMGALKNQGNEVVTPGGARYRAIYLGGSSYKMSLATLRRLEALVRGGATVVGMAPDGDPGVAGNAADYARLVKTLWPGRASAAVGKGRVIASRDIASALQSAGVAPDFAFSGGLDGGKLPFVHRKLADGDSYFVSNPSDKPQTVEARFRVTGKAPEFWSAETGKAEPAPYRIENGVTIVPLTLVADGSIHVVFRKPATVLSRAESRAAPVKLGEVTGPWTVAFQANRGAPASTTLAKLAPLSDQADPGIKYFSGIATYSTEFEVPATWQPGQPLWLDLGDVRELAEVTVNGQAAGAAWHAPYRVDLSAAAHPGKNRLEVKVANTWVNRLAGDAKAAKETGAPKLTWTALPTYAADAPLRPSGLIGPVTIEGAK